MFQLVVIAEEELVRDLVAEISRRRDLYAHRVALVSVSSIEAVEQDGL